jgi:hypothetical protein
MIDDTLLLVRYVWLSFSPILIAMSLAILALVQWRGLSRFSILILLVVAGLLTVQFFVRPVEPHYAVTFKVLTDMTIWILVLAAIFGGRSKSVPT